jgi:hypothetical protein
MNKSGAFFNRRLRTGTGHARLNGVYLYYKFVDFNTSPNWGAAEKQARQCWVCFGARGA